MKNELAPKFIKPIGDLNVLWFQNSNNYAVLDSNLLNILNCYITANHKFEFLEKISNSLRISQNEALNYYNDLSELLESNTILEKESTSNSISDLKQELSVSNIYKIGQEIIKINYASEDIQNLIHLQYAHLAQNKTSQIQIKNHISIDHKSEQLHLYHNKKHIDSFSQSHYHLLKGKLNMLLLCIITKTNENDWLGTFHASTIGNKKEAIMFIGPSGSGKSTLSALMNSEGYDLITDDITPLRASDLNIYEFPTGISMKQGGFNTLIKLKKEPKTTIDYVLDSSKGPIKYVAPLNAFTGQHLPCTKVVMVNYKENSANNLLTISIDTALQAFISDSWISSIPVNVQVFLNWLESATFYALNYNDSKTGMGLISSLFD